MLNLLKHKAAEQKVRKLKDHPGGSKTERPSGRFKTERASGRFRNRKTIRKEQKLKEDPEDSEEDSDIEAGVS